MQCKRTYVKKESCYVKFTNKKVKDLYSTNTLKLDELGDCWTVRDEQMIFDVDKKGRVIGIELLGNKTCRKSCQNSR